MKSKQKHFSENLVVTWLFQMVLGLQFIHSKKILHRDIKPQNVLVDKDLNIKIGDFGISKILTSTVDHCKTMIGTLYYMAPQIYSQQKYTMKADIWSLGCLVYEICALEPPFIAKGMYQLIQQVKIGKIKNIPEIYSKDLQKLVSKMLTRDPSKRPNTAQLLKDPMLVDLMIRNSSSMSLRQQYSKDILKPTPPHTAKVLTNSFIDKQTQAVHEQLRRFQQQVKGKMQKMKKKSPQVYGNDVDQHYDELKQKMKEIEKAISRAFSELKNKAPDSGTTGNVDMNKYSDAVNNKSSCLSDSGDTVLESVVYGQNQSQFLRGDEGYKNNSSNASNNSNATINLKSKNSPTTIATTNSNSHQSSPAQSSNKKQPLSRAGSTSSATGNKVQHNQNSTLLAQSTSFESVPLNQTMSSKTKTLTKELQKYHELKLRKNENDIKEKISATQSVIITNSSGDERGGKKKGNQSNNSSVMDDNISLTVDDDTSGNGELANLKTCKSDNQTQKSSYQSHFNDDDSQEGWSNGLRSIKKREASLSQDQELGNTLVSGYQNTIKQSSNSNYTDLDKNVLAIETLNKLEFLKNTLTQNPDAVLSGSLLNFTLSISSSDGGGLGLESMGKLKSRGKGEKSGGKMIGKNGINDKNSLSLRLKGNINQNANLQDTINFDLTKRSSSTSSVQDSIQQSTTNKNTAALLKRKQQQLHGGHKKTLSSPSSQEIPESIQRISQKSLAASLSSSQSSSCPSSHPQARKRQSAEQEIIIQEEVLEQNDQNYGNQNDHDPQSQKYLEESFQNYSDDFQQADQEYNRRYLHNQFQESSDDLSASGSALNPPINNSMKQRRRSQLNTIISFYQQTLQDINNNQSELQENTQNRLKNRYPLVMSEIKEQNSQTGSIVSTSKFNNRSGNDSLF